MEKNTTKAFVTDWDEKTVTCLFLIDEEQNITQFRVTNRKPFFDGMKIFKGKNVWFDTVAEVGMMTLTNNESKKSKLVQLWNYYINQNFKIK